MQTQIEAFCGIKTSSSRQDIFLSYIGYDDEPKKAKSTAINNIIVHLFDVGNKEEKNKDTIVQQYSKNNRQNICLANCWKIIHLILFW